MLQNPKLWEKIYALRARAREVCVEAQQARWKAEHIRYTAQLTRLARHMPGANSLTLALTTTLLRQHSLLDDVTLHQPAARRDPCTDGTSALLDIRRAVPSSPDSGREARNRSRRRGRRMHGTRQTSWALTRASRGTTSSH